MLRKILTIAGCAVLAIGLWLYVVLVIGPEYTETFYDVEVKLVGELSDDFMILGDYEHSVDLTLSGNRSDLNKINSSNILVELDISKIQQEGRSAYRYEVQIPDTITIENRDPAGITLDVVSREKKLGVPIAFHYDKDKLPSGYDVLEVKPEMSSLDIAGPADVIAQIESAAVNIEITDKDVKDITGEYDLIFLNKDGKKVDDSNITRLTPGSEMIEVELPVRRQKKLPLKLHVLEGGGLTEEDITYDPAYIIVLGTEEDLALYDAWYLNKKENPLDLSQLEPQENQMMEMNFLISLPRNIKEVNGMDKNEKWSAKATISFKGLKTEKITIPTEQITVNGIPENGEPDFGLLKAIEITVRGPEKSEFPTADMLDVSVDCTGAEIVDSEEDGKTWEVTVKIKEEYAEKYSQFGVIKGPYSVYVIMWDKEKKEAEREAIRLAEEERMREEEEAGGRTEGVIPLINV